MVATFAKKSGSSSDTDKRYAGLHAQSRVDLSDGAQSRTPTQVLLAADLGRWVSRTNAADDSSTLAHVSATLTSADYLRFGSRGSSSTRSVLQLYPRAGAFRRTDKAGTDAGVAGGAYAGVGAVFRVGEIFDTGVFNRFSVESDAQWVRPTRAQDRAIASTVSRYSASLVMNLADTPNSPFKPSISLSRTVGADPVTDEARKVQTSIMLHVAYN